MQLQIEQVLFNNLILQQKSTGLWLLTRLLKYNMSPECPAKLADLSTWRPPSF